MRKIQSLDHAWMSANGKDMCQLLIENGNYFVRAVSKDGIVDSSWRKMLLSYSKRWLDLEVEDCSNPLTLTRSHRLSRGRHGSHRFVVGQSRVALPKSLPLHINPYSSEKPSHASKAEIQDFQQLSKPSRSNKRVTLFKPDRC